MAIVRPWKSLHVEGEFPILWLKACLDETGAVLQLTDLNRLWGTQLSRAEINQSAADQRCSIDPSEDDEQYDQFLAKISGALSGEEETKVAVQAGDEQDAVRLSVSVPLPGSLPTFQWSIGLRIFSDAENVTFASDLTMPLLVYVSNLKSHAHQLVEELGHKDRVISKITDKLETSGNDLTQVFPIVSSMKISKKSSQRSQLAKYVEGLADFDEAAWKTQKAKKLDEEDPSVEDIDSILAGLPQPRLLGSHKDGMGAWYRGGSQRKINVDRDTDSENPRSSKASRRRSAAQNVPSLPDDESTQVDEFERRTTPPRTNGQPKSSSPAPANGMGKDSGSNLPPQAPSAGGDDETTDDDDDDDGDLDSPSQRSLSSRQVSQQQSASSRTLSQYKESSQPGPSSIDSSKVKHSLSSTGRTKVEVKDSETETDDAAPASPRNRKPKAKLGAFGNAKASKTLAVSQDESALSEARLTENELSEQQSPPKRKSKLGAFNGKSKAVPSLEPEASSPRAAKPRSKLGAFGRKSKKDPSPLPEEVDTNRVAVEPQKGAGRLGAFGGKACGKDVPEPSTEPTSEAERPPRTAEEVAVQEREDSQQRANKKREKLKRELEEKSKAPVKKKRKF